MTTTVPDTAAIQRRTLTVLMLSVGPAGMGMAGGFSATTLAAEDITNSDVLATLAATMISIGGAIAAVPLARFMAANGRRPGLRIGWTIAGIGSLGAFVAVLTDVYPLLVAGAFAIGVGNGTNLAARYAAADLALPDRRVRTIGLLVWASSIGSVLGPTVALGPTGWFAEQIIGLFLIGLGWSFAMIAGSSLLTGAFPVHERANVQGAADFTMVTSGAVHAPTISTPHR